MDNAEEIQVSPIYGWGWFEEDGGSIDVPPAFRLKIDLQTDGRLDGVIVTPEHRFVGFVTELTKRHVDWDGCVNVRLRRNAERDWSASGFAMIEMSVVDWT